MTTSTTSTARTGWKSGPLIVTALVFAVLTIAGAALEPTVVRPGSSPQDVLEHLAARSGMLSVAAVAQVGSALSLIGFAAVLVKRPPHGGEAVAALNVCIASARLAATSLVVGALAGWTAVQSAVLGDAASTKALGTLWFAAGGVGFVATFGLLLLGLAAPASTSGVLPRPLSWAVVGLGVLSILGAAALVIPALYPLMPVGKFGGALALVAVSVVLGREWSRS